MIFGTPKSTKVKMLFLDLRKMTPEQQKCLEGLRSLSLTIEDHDNKLTPNELRSRVKEALKPTEEFQPIKKMVPHKRKPYKKKTSRDYKKWTNDELNNIVEMKMNGKSFEEIAEHFGKNISTIQTTYYNYLKKHPNLSKMVLKKTMTRKRWTPEEIETMKRMRKNGSTFGDIAKRLGRTFDSVYIAYKKHVSK